MCQAVSEQSANLRTHSCWKHRYWVLMVLVMFRGVPAKLQGVLSIPLRTASPALQNSNIITLYECKKYLFKKKKKKTYVFSKPFHLDLTSGFRLVFNVTKKHLLLLTTENA